MTELAQVFRDITRFLQGDFIATKDRFRFSMLDDQTLRLTSSDKKFRFQFLDFGFVGFDMRSVVLSEQTGERIQFAFDKIEKNIKVSDQAFDTVQQNKVNALRYAILLWFTLSVCLIHFSCVHLPLQRISSTTALSDLT